jgi:hypothetical protein
MKQAEAPVSLRIAHTRNSNCSSFLSLRHRSGFSFLFCLTLRSACTFFASFSIVQ